LDNYYYVIRQAGCLEDKGEKIRVGSRLVLSTLTALTKIFNFKVGESPSGAKEKSKEKKAEDLKPTLTLCRLLLLMSCLYRLHKAFIKHVCFRVPTRTQKQFTFL